MTSRILAFLYGLACYAVYAEYRKRVPMLIPFLHRGASASPRAGAPARS